MRSLRLLHTSDVHLGAAFRTPEGGRHRDPCLCPLAALEDAVATHRPDAVLVAGDLFDQQRLEDELIDEVLRRLGELDPVCVVISGNHDLHDDRSPYGRLTRDRDKGTGPGGLVFLDRPAGSTVELLDGDLVVWAKAMEDHHRGYRPLHDVPARPRSRTWWVVMGHGHYEAEPGTEPIRSSPLTATDIDATGADYVALGHWHARADVSTEGVTAWYSGAPDGPGATGLLNLVELSADRGVTVAGVGVRMPGSGCEALVDVSR